MVIPMFGRLGVNTFYQKRNATFTGILLFTFDLQHNKRNCGIGVGLCDIATYNN